MAEAPYNVLMILADQHHAGLMGCSGFAGVQTPNLDGLAAEGMRFTNAYCPRFARRAA